jgi:hypothetical protein
MLAVKNFSAVVNGVTKLVAALYNVVYQEVTDLETILAAVCDTDGKIVSTGLKTTTGEISVTGYSDVLQALPGGEYGFFPQLKSAAGNNADFVTLKLSGVGTIGTSYATLLSISSAGAGIVLYAQQRYMTASGEDLWIFLLVDKITKGIIAAYQAPDHPSYGNGEEPDKFPHPFASYDATKHEIVLIDKETCLTIKQESKDTGKSILTLVNENYKPGKDADYQPLHSGQFLDKKKVMIETIPDYIKVKKLIKSNKEG